MVFSTLLLLRGEKFHPLNPRRGGLAPAAGLARVNGTFDISSHSARAAEKEKEFGESAGPLGRHRVPCARRCQISAEIKSTPAVQRKSTCELGFRSSSNCMRYSSLLLCCASYTEENARGRNENDLWSAPNYFTWKRQEGISLARTS
jgi:hypothetical protein